MTTYTKETALYDTGAIADDIADAGTTASDYITAVTNDGIWVHPQGAGPVSGSPTVNTSGWHISDAIELFRQGVSHIKMWVENSVAKLRLGAANSTHVMIDNDSLDIEDGSSNTLASFSNSGVTFSSYYGGQLDYDVSLVPYGTDVKREWGSAVETLGVGGYKVQTTAGVGMPGANGSNSLPLFLSGMFVQSSNALFDAVDVNVYLASRKIEAGESIGVHANINDPNYSFKVDNDGVIVLGTHTTAEENGIKLKGGGTREGWVLRTVSASNGDGDAIIIGDGGLTVVGGGESATNLLNALGVGPGTEQLHLASDNGVHIHTNCQTIANRQTVDITANGSIVGPNNHVVKLAGVDSSASDNGVTATTYRYHSFIDESDRYIGWLGTTVATDGDITTTVAARRRNGSANFDNMLSLGVTKEGKRTVAFSDKQPWLDALKVGTLKVVDISTSVSAATSTNKSIGSISLEAGKWLVFYGVVFATNANGTRSVFMYTTQNAAANASWYRETCVQTPPVSGSSTYLRGSFIARPSSTTTYYLTVWQNSGSAINCTGNIQAIRIG